MHSPVAVAELDRGIRKPAAFSERRVAIVHYWMVSMRGGERVVERGHHGERRVEQRGWDF